MTTIPYKVDDNECWIWQKSTTGKRGYAQVGAGKVAHKVYWESKHGPVPDGKQLHHTCERFTCVNPDHLKCVTTHEHARIHSPLSEVEVNEIRNLRGVLSQRKIASKFGISQSAVCRIQTGERWGDLEPEDS